MEKMDHSEVQEFAASWGSFMTSGDPGACMYGFDETGRPQNEKHRADCIEEMEKNRAYVAANPSEYDADELAKIDSFLAYIKEANTIPDRTLTYANLKAEFNMSGDGDAWGTTMSWMFAIAAELTHRNEETPMDYRPGAGGNHREIGESMEADICEMATTEALTNFGKVLNRYDDLLRRHGKSY